VGIALLNVFSDVDPKDLAVNKRYKSSQALTPEVKHAMQKLQGQVFDAVMEDSRFPLYAWYEVTMTLYFKNNKGDIDGPIKHAIDALEAGINQAHAGERVFNDKQIEVLTVYKHVTSYSIRPPGIDIRLYGSGEVT
jgi:Holliday junction resolvase RusA-like endonuclease